MNPYFGYGLRVLAAVLPLAGWIAVTHGQSSLPPSGFEVGQPFPDIVLPSLEDGRPGSIAQFRGRKVLLHVFASW